ncbi:MULTISPECIES: ABC transporter permease subunit [Subtercola]|uniref:ABC transporter permease n=1 Tax=Subtercola vilae TaxID=2056433 RepID=A0A4T2C740_9MICO|nr:MULTISPECIES: ABC transporter permease subunit [Subtercola]MEA9984379.1 ABC transporter permease subunit [Subtercola sp. RTI3]TIH40057.1 ABC transporter permease [Subtercola vilae]
MSRDATDSVAEKPDDEHPGDGHASAEHPAALQAPDAHPHTLPLLRQSLVGSWRSLLAWSLGLAATILLYMPLFPSLGGANSQLSALLASLPPQLIKTLGYTDIASGSGYAESTFFGLVGFLLMSAAATTWGSAAIAGDEESGALELILAHGVSRHQLVLERSLAVTVRLVVLAAVSGALLAAVNPSSQLGLAGTDIVAACAAFLGLGLVSGSAALMVGALTGRRLFSTAAGAGVAAVSYVVNAIGSQSAALDALRSFTPYGWAYRHTPLATGADLPGLALLFGLSALFTVVAVAALRRRDISGA